MTDKEIIIDGVDVSEWTDEEVRYKFEKHSPKAIRQIAFDLYKQLKRKEQKLNKIQTICEKESTKSTFYNGIENKDLQKLAIKILKIIEGKNNG